MDESAQNSDSDGGMFPAPQERRPVGAYRVLARKYRPSRFEDLIGQEPMVRTLKNAFDLDRIHQAYMLTGVRGVGKTTTARILARAFNYQLPARDGHPAVDRPTIHMAELGVHCQAIMDSRHVDVIEMDAASHTSIDDIREIVDSSRYQPAMARYKVYIIDEVHMLSKSAFNGLLKTLEEPPAHVKFLFATTEIDKVPVTVRSRCMRFDLRRIDTEVMLRHLAGICDKEKVEINHEALLLIARASEGSVRDALSLLDQAIAHGAGAPIEAEALRTMLGLADRSRTIALFEAVMRGDIAEALDTLKEQYDFGADPAKILTDLAEFVHFVTCMKISAKTAEIAAGQFEREKGAELAQKLAMSVLSRAWQILLKGIDEVKDSPRPLAAANMVLVRLAYAADLPSPEDVLRRLGGGASASTSEPARGPSGPSGGASAALRAAPQLATVRVAPAPRPAQAGPVAQIGPVAQAAPEIMLREFADLVALAAEKRDIQTKTALECDVRLVRFEQGRLEFALAPGASPTLPAQLSRKLQDWTGARWLVALSSQPGAPTLKEQAEARENERRVGVQAHPLVRATLERFPGAVIVAVRGGEDEESSPTAPLYEGAEARGDEITYADEAQEEDL
ncbi:DNA polymerase-3 subunit gamma/tau [Rhodoblastus acidophilus]|uniref:DNA polymerase III subunit gamma/tau n=2 Tax=Rhodoblastus acidophilus TaxID=1074 RepID=A0A212S1P9_RHOAC|nr:DNA polymerase III subunit gamma/tau [Rhodoblastus acidophilus]RAI16481.1 DNA polymerase III subunit gamma/tau [Rhodoblastus acidophilus]SNB78946.1 DNA polymerase-3 subunit gamma/tau [Rhodoblastus acidophilus]